MMLTHTMRWSHAPGNPVVPSRWQATFGFVGRADRGLTRDSLTPRWLLVAWAPRKGASVGVSRAGCSGGPFSPLGAIWEPIAGVRSWQR